MSNIKIFIVDDEYLIRNLIKNRIAWGDLGMEIIGEAADARKALEVIDNLVPDIIFTDICMPFMDGIEFSKRVIERYPHIKIVIITGHDEFDYAKRSLKLGVSDFLLKPVNADEIRKVALELKNKIDAEKMHNKEYENLKQQLELNLPFLKEKFMIQLLHGEVNTVELEEKLRYFHINLNPEYHSYQIAVVEVSNSEKNISNEEENRILLAIQCAEQIRQSVKEYKDTHVFLDNSRRVVLLCNSESLDLNDYCEAIKSILITTYHCFISIGIGNKVKGIENIMISYREACDAINYKIVIGKNQVVNYSDITYSYEIPWRGLANTVENINFYIKAGMVEKMHQLLDELFLEGCYCPSITIENMRLEAFDILSACMHALMELNIDTAGMWDYPTQPYQTVSRIDNINELKNYMKSFITKVINKVNCVNNKKVNSLISQIKEYINDNIHNDELSLSAVTKEFYISSSHLCRLFKQETNQTFVEYITKVRMETAIKILKDSDLKVYEIGEKVGIKDPHYFSIIFKKFTGVSVNEFRKSSKG